jgi:hypothetical protein
LVAGIRLPPCFKLFLRRDNAAPCPAYSLQSARWPWGCRQSDTLWKGDRDGIRERRQWRDSRRVTERRRPDFRICQDAKRRLQEARDARGRRLEIIEVPLTSYDISYLNFYFANGCVLVPTSGRRAENRRALAILNEAFPKREIIGINSEVLGTGGGGIHCITQQVPAI